MAAGGACACAVRLQGWGGQEAPPPWRVTPHPIPRQGWGGLSACSAPPAPRRESQRSDRPEPPEQFLVQALTGELGNRPGEGQGLGPAQRVRPTQRGRQRSRLRGRVQPCHGCLLWEPEVLRSQGTLPTPPTWDPLLWASTHGVKDTLNALLGSGPWKEMRRKKRWEAS